VTLDSDRPIDPAQIEAGPEPGGGRFSGEPDDVAASGPRVAERAASLAEVVFCSGLPSQLLLALLLQAAGWTPLEPDGRLSLRYVVTISLLDSVLVVALAVLFLVTRGERWQDVYFGRRRAVREVGVGIAAAPAILLGVAAVGTLLRAVFPWLHNVTDNPFAALMTTPEGLAIFAVVVVIAGGVREEVQRAFVLHRFRQHLGGAMFGLWLFSLAFGLGHLVQGYDAAILTGLLGFAWGVLYLRRGSVIAPMVSHSLFNLLEVLREALTV
jgi:membrane protease YdiL (CAAX protease family)